MELFGLGLGQLLAVLGASAAATVALYLLRLRRRELRVPNLALFREVLAERRSTAWLSQRTRWLSLLLALLVLAAMVLALGDPRPKRGRGAGRTLAVLVDVSASMQATDVTPTRLERAKQEARKLARSLGPSDRMIVVGLGHDAVPVSPLSNDEPVLIRAIDELEGLDVHEDLRAGLALATDLLHDESRPEIVLLSDLASVEARESLDLADRRIRASHVRIGRARENVAISAFAVRRYPLDRSQSEVMIELVNESREARSVELTLLGDGAAVDVRTIDLPAGERVQRFLEYVSGANETLEARIAPADAKPDHLPADDRAYAVLPPRQRVTVLVVTPGNLYLEAALLLDELLEVTYLAPSEYQSAQGYDAVIFDGFVPSASPGRPAIYLHPAPAPGAAFRPFEVRGTLTAPTFARVERRDPLLRFTALEDVNVAEALQLVPARGDRVLAADPRGPLLVRGEREGTPVLGLAFDVRASDLPMRVAWPLLLLHAIESFVADAGDFVSSYRTDAVVRAPVDTARGRVQVVQPDGTRLTAPVQEGRVVFTATRTGFHRVRTEHGEVVIATNLGAGAESRIAPGTPPRIAGREPGRPSRGRAYVATTPWVYLIGLAMGLLLLEWLTYHRRWTV